MSVSRSGRRSGLFTQKEPHIKGGEGRWGLMWGEHHGVLAFSSSSHPRAIRWAPGNPVRLITLTRHSLWARRPIHLFTVGVYFGSRINLLEKLNYIPVIWWAERENKETGWRPKETLIKTMEAVTVFLGSLCMKSCSGHLYTLVIVTHVPNPRHVAPGM